MRGHKSIKTDKLTPTKRLPCRNGSLVRQVTFVSLRRHSDLKVETASKDAQASRVWKHQPWWWSVRHGASLLKGGPSDHHWNETLRVPNSSCHLFQLWPWLTDILPLYQRCWNPRKHNCRLRPLVVSPCSLTTRHRSLWMRGLPGLL